MGDAFLIMLMVSDSDRNDLLARYPHGIPKSSCEARGSITMDTLLLTLLKDEDGVVACHN